MNSDLGKKLTLCGTALYLFQAIVKFVFILVELFTFQCINLLLLSGEIITILAFIFIALGFIIRFRSGRSIIDLLTAAFVGLLVIIELLYMGICYMGFYHYIPDIVLMVMTIPLSLFGFVFVVYAMRSNRRNMLISLVTGTFYCIVELDRNFQLLIFSMISNGVEEAFDSGYINMLGAPYIWEDTIYTSIYLIMAVIFFIVVLKCMDSSVEQTVIKKESAVSDDGSGRNAISFDSLFGESNDSGEQKTEPVKKSNAPSKKSASDMMDDLFNG